MRRLIREILFGMVPLMLISSVMASDLMNPIWPPRGTDRLTFANQDLR